MSTVSVYDFTLEVDAPVTCPICAEAIEAGRFRLNDHETHTA